MSAYAVPRSEKEALQEAVSFFRSNPSVRRAAGTSTALKYAYSAVQANGEAAFYVFNRGENEGFVMVSAESNTPTIIGYSETGERSRVRTASRRLYAGSAAVYHAMGARHAVQ